MNCEILSAPRDMSKVVCIIIPVYNAEKFLGYCLNSVLSQSYTNWKAILINDGSTDGSLEICNQYAALDSRFQVISIDNGGVSRARNVGLDHAEGDYLYFLDSDDCLEAQILEKQVRAAQIYDSQLIVNDIQQVDFTNPSSRGPRMTSAWLGESPVVLEASQFHKKYMRIIWNTALMEGPTCKLYDLKLWRQLNLSFPTELSLGEDFVTNMKYYSAVNRVFFLRDVGYFYNNKTDSDSLTHKYRPDLFENKHYLMEQLQENLESFGEVPQKEWDAFYNYASSSLLNCVADMIDNAQQMSHAEKVARLKQMCDSPLLISSLQKATWLKEEYSEWKSYILSGDYDSVISRRRRKVHAPQQEDPEINPGFTNKAVRMMLRMVRPAFGHGAMGNRIAVWEEEIYQYGLKTMVSSHLRYRKKANFDQLEPVIQRLDAVYGQGQSQTENLLRQLEADLQQQAEAVIRRTSEYIWDSEQRMTRDHAWTEINDLRQKKKALMLATAEHENIGDSAITIAEQNILSQQFPEYYQVEISTYMYDQKEEYLHAILNPDDIIFINGGGNIGDYYPAEQQLHCRILEDFPDHKIVIFPQTICFSETEKGREARDEFARLCSGHPDLTFFVRGGESLQFAGENFPNVKTILMPDVVHVLRARYNLVRQGALLCLRTDTEGVLKSQNKERIDELLQQKFKTVERTTNMADTPIYRDTRGLVVRREMKKYAASRVAVTDRLHGMIFAAATNTPCVVLSSYNHKISEYYKAFFADSNAVFYIGNDLSQLEGALEKAAQVTDPIYPIFETAPHSKFRELCMGEAADL